MKTESLIHEKLLTEKRAENEALRDTDPHHHALTVIAKQAETIVRLENELLRPSEAELLARLKALESRQKFALAENEALECLLKHGLLVRNDPRVSGNALVAWQNKVIAQFPKLLGLATPVAVEEAGDEVRPVQTGTMQTQWSVEPDRLPVPSQLTPEAHLRIWNEMILAYHNQSHISFDALRYHWSKATGWTPPE